MTHTPLGRAASDSALPQFPTPGRPPGSRPPGRIPPGIFALPFGVLILLAGLWGGLGLLGYSLPMIRTSASEHGFLMSLGFIGTLIATERAVALARWWAWGVPTLSVLGSAWVVFGGPPAAGYALLCASGVLFVVVYARLDRIQRSTHNTLMGLAAAGWAVAAALALGGEPVRNTVPWLAIFLVVTITAERLELSRMLKRSRPVRVSLIVAILAMVAGATLSMWLPDSGVRLTGLAMLAMAVWLGIYDLARRTIRAKVVTRFMAAGLLAGYVWLAGGGALWAIAGYPPNDGFLHDAELHTIFLGFVMSMIFAHAPVIAPAVIRKPLPYFPIFYGPLILLHAGLILRVLVGDAAGIQAARQWGGILNEVAILAFVAITVGAFARQASIDRALSAARMGARMTQAAAAQAVAAQAPTPPAAAPSTTTPQEGIPLATTPSATTPRASTRRPTRTLSAVGGGLIGAAIVVAAVLFANSGTSSPIDSSAPPPASSADVIDAATAAAGVDVSLVEMRIEPSTIRVEPGSHLVLHVTNNGTMRHDLHLDTGEETALLAPGESATLDAGVITAAVDGWCTVPGHRQMGMTMSIGVATPDATTPSGQADSGTGGTAGMDGMGGMGGMGGMHHGMGSSDGTSSQAPPQSNDAVSKDLSVAPPAGWAPIDASLPPAPDTTVHDVTWHVKDVKTVVAPDMTQMLWTFDGQVPGPALRGKVGDRFNVTLINDTQMEHNIDFHAEAGPPAKVMQPVPPGGSHTYSFVAEHAGAFLYHCSVEPMLMHMGNGMYGAVIIDPPNLPPASAEYVLVGSELFFGPEGDVGDYNKMLADKPDAVVFNGYPFAYKHQPLTAKTGELVRIWVVDAGPTRWIAFHMIGAQFTSEYLNGAYLLKDGRSAGMESGAAQTLPVDPGNGGFVELRFSEPGSYPFLTHAMADAVIGAEGSFTVTD